MNIKDVQMLGVLADSMVGGSTYAIERQEKAEQQRATSTTNLPLDCSEKAAWEALGVVFGEKVDDLFCKATLPEGWSVQATSHSMNNDILDAQGRKRGSYFYKGAFYDRCAMMYPPVRRYRAERDWSDDVPEGKVAAVVKDGETVLWRSEEVDRVPMASPQPVVLEAVAWLKERYPDHEDAAAYWEAE